MSRWIHIDNRGLPVPWTHKLFIGRMSLAWYWTGESVVFFWIPIAATAFTVTFSAICAYVICHFLAKYW